LLDDAASKSPEELTRDVAEFRLSSAHGDDMAKRQRARRYLRFFAGPEGTLGINGLLPPVEGTELKNRLAAIVDAQWRKDHPDRAKTLGGHDGDTYDQRTADALLSMAGSRSPQSNPSSAPADAPPADKAAEENPGAPSATESKCSTSSSSQTIAKSNVGEGPFEVDSRRPVRPENALPMRVGLRLVGLPPPSGVQDPNRSASGLVNGEAKPTKAVCGPELPGGLARSDEQSFGTTVKTAKPAVVIVFDVDRWKARIAGGSPIPITESLLDQARNDLYYCFKNTVGEVIKFARSRRDPTPIQRLVLVVRDEKCLYPACHAPPDACDAHHLNEVVKDNGRTDTDVLGLFCEAHHRHIHLNDLVVKRNPDGSITIIEPEQWLYRIIPRSAPPSEATRQTHHALTSGYLLRLPVDGRWELGGSSLRVNRRSTNQFTPDTRARSPNRSAGPLLAEHRTTIATGCRTLHEPVHSRYTCAYTRPFTLPVLAEHGRVVATGFPNTLTGEFVADVGVSRAVL
jgi:hypothetical protein